MLADAFTHTAAKHSGEMDRMDAGFEREFVEGEAAAVLGLQLVENAREPAWSMAAFALSGARREGKNFGEEAFDGKIIARRSSFNFAKELHGEPKKRAAADVVAGHVQRGGAVGKALLPRRAKLDFVKAHTAGADFILMRNTRGPEHDAEGAVLGLLPATALAVQAVEEQSDKREFVRMHGELARSGMANVCEDGAALLAFAVDGAEETARAHVLKGGGAGNVWACCSVRHGEASAVRLRLF